MKSTPKNRRRVGWILLIVLAVLVAAVAVIWSWQKNNIEAVLQFTQYSQEELENKLEENDQNVSQVLQAAMEQAHQVDPEQVQSETKPPEETVTAEETSADVPEKPKGPTYEEQMQVIVDKVYALRDSYVSQLEDLEKEAIAAYKALPAAQRTAKGKIEFASGYITRATELEKACDGEMDQIVAELTQLQKTYGQSLELVETVKYTYANEKSLKKAWYMSELERRGMI